MGLHFEAKLLNRSCSSFGRFQSRHDKSGKTLFLGGPGCKLMKETAKSVSCGGKGDRKKEMLKLCGFK